MLGSGWDLENKSDADHNIVIIKSRVLKLSIFEKTEYLSF